MVRIVTILLLIVGGVWSKGIVLIDGSGSMEGFFRSNSIYTFSQRIIDAFPYPVEVRVFVSPTPDTVEFFPSAEFDVSKVGSYTRLKKALQKTLEEASDFIILITDNVPTGEDDTDFIHLLSAPSIKAVWVIPYITDYDGKVYLPLSYSGSPHCKNGSFRLSRRLRGSLVFNYRGKRGFLVYILALSDEFYKEMYGDDGVDHVRSLLGVQGIRDVILVKPIDWRSVVIRPEIEIDKIKAALDSLLKICSSLSIKWLPPGGRLTRGERGNVNVVPIVPGRKVFEVPATSSGILAVYFSVGTRMPYVIIKGEEPCSSGITIRIDSLRVKILRNSSIYSDDELLKYINIKVEPAQLMGQLYVSESDSIGWNKFVYRISVIKRALRIPWNPIKILKLLFSGSPLVEISFTLDVYIPPKVIHMVSSVEEKWFTRDIGELDKIYSPKDLIHYLCRDTIKIHYRVTR